jgi:predicted TIM-barrel fold metal-dependent hydrolase
MFFSRSFFLLAVLAPLAVFAEDAAVDSTAVTQEIVDNARADNIDLSVVPGLDAALAAIAATYTETNTTAETKRSVSSRWTGKRAVTNIIDAHTHIVPDWYRAMVPTTGGNPTPAWDVDSYISFMNTQGISRSIFAFSAPGANVNPGSEGLTVALARLMNEQSAAYVRAHPDKFSFYATVPLPFTAAAITEANYALDKLGAVGIVLFSNFEGTYLGNAAFRPFFDAMNKRPGKTICYVHPSAPYLKVNGQLVEANPTTYPTGNIEFYFETARMMQDMFLSQTILNFTNINYVIPHVGGSAPSIFDRLLKTVPTLYDPIMNALRTRVFWDSAGPTYYHQVNGLLAYGIPSSQLLFGTDFPYAPSFTQAASLAAVANANVLSVLDKTLLFSGNAKSLFKDKIKF